ncbi:MAG: thiamine pyrophosphate-binding protein [Candidatus Aureabacteria bacterium]|nr:thiamine pyrophosphate-binding protein [Candidatus Auribacterota bacterium]
MRTIKVTDYICNCLADHGVQDVFMISGGGAMHLVDSVGRNPRLKYYCTHHEQAAAIAAEGYARASGKMAAVVVTSGPGSTNALTGVIGQWLDSVPVVYLSGQVKLETTIESCREIGLRQLGDQEINIVDIVRPVTKFAAMVQKPDRIRWNLEKAIYLATHGRFGPVWLDIPLDVQAAMIDEDRLEAYSPEEDEKGTDRSELAGQVGRVVEMLQRAERPIFLAGQGIRLAGSIGTFREVIKNAGIPTVTSFCGYDLLPTGHPLYAGRPGTVGSRFGNLALQNADLLLSVGSRNNIRQISYNWRLLARGAQKVVVDIDEAELRKPTVKPDLPICADAGDFLEELKRQLGGVRLPAWENWMRWCAERRQKYPVILPEYWKEKGMVNPYCFMDALTGALGEGATVVSGNGTACVTLFQAGVVKESQRIFWNSGCASMGYDLPAAIGACIAIGKRRVICLAGDGSLQMNIQELQTVVTHDLPITLFVLNNNGYNSIRQTQDTYFEGRHTACDPGSGVRCPDIQKVARAYGLNAELIPEQEGMGEKIHNALRASGPVVCEVMLSPTQRFMPRVSSERKPDGRMVSKPLEDMYPFLPRDEFRANMIVAPLPEDTDGEHA